MPEDLLPELPNVPMRTSSAPSPAPVDLLPHLPNASASAPAGPVDLLPHLPNVPSSAPVSMQVRPERPELNTQKAGEPVEYLKQAVADPGYAADKRGTLQRYQEQAQGKLPGVGELDNTSAASHGVLDTVVPALSSVRKGLVMDPAKTLLRAAGSTNPDDLGKYGKQAADWIDQDQQRTYGGDPNSTVNQIAHATGSAIAMLPGAASNIPARVGIAALAGYGGLSGYQSAVEQGAPEGSAGAIGSGLVGAAANAIPIPASKAIAGALTPLVGKSLVKQVGANIAANYVEQAALNVGSNVVNNAIAGATYDPGRPLTSGTREALISSIPGAVVFGGVAAQHQRVEQRQRSADFLAGGPTEVVSPNRITDPETGQQISKAARAALKHVASTGDRQVFGFKALTSPESAPGAMYDRDNVYVNVDQPVKAMVSLVVHEALGHVGGGPQRFKEDIPNQQLLGEIQRIMNERLGDVQASTQVYIEGLRAAAQDNPAMMARYQMVKANPDLAIEEGIARLFETAIHENPEAIPELAKQAPTLLGKIRQVAGEMVDSLPVVGTGQKKSQRQASDMMRVFDTLNPYLDAANQQIRAEREVIRQNSEPYKMATDMLGLGPNRGTQPEPLPIRPDIENTGPQQKLASEMFGMPHPQEVVRNNSDEYKQVSDMFGYSRPTPYGVKRPQIDPEVAERAEKFGGKDAPLTKAVLSGDFNKTIGNLQKFYRPFSDWLAKNYSGSDDVEKIADHAERDIRSILGGDELRKYGEYYGKERIRERQALGQKFPEIVQDKNKWDLYNVFWALGSNGTRLPDNVAEAVDAYSHFRKGGTFSPGAFKAGEDDVLFRGPYPGTKKSHYAKFQSLVDQLGEKDAVKFLKDSHSLAELNAVKRKLGWAEGIDAPRVKEIVRAATGQDAEAPGSFIFGPKLGAYMQNGFGRKAYQTGDLWEGLFYRIYASGGKGLEFDEAGDPIRHPASKEDQEKMVRFGDIIQQALDMKDPAGAQAQRWFTVKKTLKLLGYSKAGSMETSNELTQKYLDKRETQGDAAELARARRAAAYSAGDAGSGGGSDVLGGGRATPAGVRRADVPLEAEEAPLKGAPAEVRPNPELRRVAREFARSNGINRPEHDEYIAVDPARAKRIADAFDAMKHSPNDPAVVRSYEAMGRETVAQWKALENAGYKIEPWHGEGEPYKNSAEMKADVANNKHLWYFETNQGFGSGGDASDHFLLKPSGVVVNGKDIPYNDLFRAVHDLFGHAVNGNGFGPRGEENAWATHAAMYSDEARPAMTAETRGQNSWVNYGPYGEQNRANPKETRFADQKMGILPEEFNRLPGEQAPTPAALNRKQPLQHEPEVTEEHRRTLREKFAAISPEHAKIDRFLTSAETHNKMSPLSADILRFALAGSSSPNPVNLLIEKIKNDRGPYAQWIKNEWEAEQANEINKTRNMKPGANIFLAKDYATKNPEELGTMNTRGFEGANDVHLFLHEYGHGLVSIANANQGREIFPGFTGRKFLDVVRKNYFEMVGDRYKGKVLEPAFDPYANRYSIKENTPGHEFMREAGRGADEQANINHWVRNEDEWFAQTFANYVLANKLPEGKQGTLLHKLMNGLAIHLSDLITKVKEAFGIVKKNAPNSVDELHRALEAAYQGPDPDVAYGSSDPGLDKFDRQTRNKRGESIKDIPFDQTTSLGSIQRGEFPPTPASLRKGTPTPGDRFTLEGESVLDYLRKKTQDEFLPFRRVQEQVAKQGGSVTEASDANLKQTLFKGRVGETYRKIDDHIVKPIVQLMTKAKLSVEDVDNYLYALHAGERNAQIAKINPAMPDGGSGKTTADAAADLARWNADPRIGELQQIARQVHRLNRGTLKKLVALGLLDRKAAKAMQSTYQHYVPLRDDDGEGLTAGQGYTAKSAGIKRATGRGEVADSPLLFSILQAREKVVRAEKNRVVRAAARFVRSNPDPKLWAIDKVPTKAMVNPRTGMVEHRIDPRFQFADNVVPFMQHGKMHLIEFKGEAGARMAAALKRTNYEDGGFVVHALGKAMRGYASLQTNLNPAFIGPNLIRDVGTSFLRVAGDEGVAKAARITNPKNLWGAMKAVWAVTGDDAAGAGEKYHDAFREYREHGGKVDGYMIGDYQSTGAELEKLLKHADPKTIFQRGSATFNKIKDFVDRLNGTVETATRLSAYVEARKDGMSPERAAYYAKELTVNFNRKGEWGTPINMLYLFSNASTQGNVNVIRSLIRGKNGHKTAAALAGLGLAAGLTGKLLFGKDDENRDVYATIPDAVKGTNLLVPTGGGTYAKVPMPYGFNTVYNAGRLLGESITGTQSPGEASMNLISNGANAFSPLGQEGSLLQTLSPTLIDPLVQQAENKSWTGRPIVPTKYRESQPNSTLATRDTSSFSKGVANWLNEVTGGDKVTPGMIDVSPALLDHWIGWASGGAGREAYKTASLPYEAATGQLTPNKTPLLNRFIGSQNVDSLNRKDMGQINKTASDAVIRGSYYLNTGQVDKFEELQQETLRDREYHEWSKEIRKSMEGQEEPDDEQRAEIERLVASYNAGEEAPRKYKDAARLSEIENRRRLMAKLKRDASTSREPGRRGEAREQLNALRQFESKDAKDYARLRLQARRGQAGRQQPRLGD